LHALLAAISPKSRLARGNPERAVHNLASADMADKHQFTILEVTSALSIGLRLAKRIATKSFDSAKRISRGAVDASQSIQPEMLR